MNLDVLGHVVEAVRSGRARIDRNPYPHLYVEDVLPPDLYEAIDRAFPSIDYIADVGPGEVVEQNTTYLRSSDRCLEDEALPDFWRAFIETNTQRTTFEHAVELFGADIAERHPTLEANFGKPLDEFEDVRDIQKRLKADGVSLASEADETTSGPASFVVVDPDGNPVLVDQHV